MIMQLILKILISSSIHLNKQFIQISYFIIRSIISEQWQKLINVHFGPSVLSGGVNYTTFKNVTTFYIVNGAFPS